MTCVPVLTAVTVPWEAPAPEHPARTCRGHAYVQNKMNSRSWPRVPMEWRASLKGSVGETRYVWLAASRAVSQRPSTCRGAGVGWAGLAEPAVSAVRPLPSAEHCCGSQTPGERGAGPWAQAGAGGVVSLLPVNSPLRP